MNGKDEKKGGLSKIWIAILVFCFLGILGGIGDSGTSQSDDTKDTAVSKEKDTSEKGSAP